MFVIFSNRNSKAKINEKVHKSNKYKNDKSYN